MSNADIGELIYISYITFRRESRQRELAFSTDGMGVENKEKFTEKDIHRCQTTTSVNSVLLDYGADFFHFCVPLYICANFFFPTFLRIKATKA